MFTPSFNESTLAQLIITSEEVRNNTLKVDIESQYPGSFEATNPFDNVVVINLPNSLVDIKNGSNFNALKIRADRSISVLGVIGLGTYATEAFSVLPIDKLGTKYNLATVQNFNTINEEFGTFGVIAVNDNTDITLQCINSNITIHSANLTIPNGMNYTVSLQYLESFYFEVQSDITGTVVQSTKPIAVFQGTKQTGRSYNYETKKYANGLQRFEIEQLLPTNSLGSEFIIPDLMYASSIEADIVPQDSTSRIFSYTGNDLKVFENKDLYKISISPKSPTSVASRTPMQLTLRVKIHKGLRTSYFKVTIPAISQFSNDYDICAPSGKVTYENFVTVIIKELDSIGLRFDGHPFTSLSESTIIYENEIYKIFHLRLSSIRVHKITHTAPDVVFGAIVYGIGDGYSYGTCAGVRL